MSASTNNGSAAARRDQTPAVNGRYPAPRAVFPCTIGPFTRWVHGVIPSVLKPKSMNINTLLTRDLLSCDVKWCFLVAAAYSVNYETNLHPFPPRFLCKDGTYNISRLLQAIHEVPNLYCLLQSMKKQNPDPPSNDVINLLHWVFVEMEQPVFRIVGPKEFKHVMTTLGQEKPYPLPTQIFAVHDMPEFGQSGAIPEAAPAKVAFYGAGFDKFFTIINRGFKRFPNIGDGVNTYTLHYQSKDALMQCHPTLAWGKSICGSVMFCVAICEVYAAPLHVHDRDNTMVVENGDLIKVRYILLYGERSYEYKYRSSKLATVMLWMQQNYVMLNLTSYIVGVFVLALSNGRIIRACHRFVSVKAVSVLAQLGRALKRFG